MPPAAEDIVSTVFLKCVNALPKYRAEQGAFGAWLYRIATNTASQAVELIPF